MVYQCVGNLHFFYDFQAAGYPNTQVQIILCRKTGIPSIIMAMIF